MNIHKELENVKHPVNMFNHENHFILGGIFHNMDHLHVKI